MNIHEDQIKSVLTRLHNKFPEVETDVWVRFMPTDKVEFTVYIHGKIIDGVTLPSICGNGTTPDAAYNQAAADFPKWDLSLQKKAEIDKLTADIEKMRNRLVSLTGVESLDEDQDLGTT